MGQVIPSERALSAPKILYFSGIGPTDILTRLGNTASSICRVRDGSSTKMWGETCTTTTPTKFLLLQSPKVQSYAFGYNGMGIGVLPNDLVSYKERRNGPYANPGQIEVFWDMVNSVNGKQIGVLIRLLDLANRSDAGYDLNIWLRSMPVSRMLCAQRLRYIWTTVPRTRRLG